MTRIEERRLIVVSNRLPIAVSRDEEGRTTVSQGAGGLVTALAPVLQNRGGTWIGWPGSSDKGLGKLLRSFSRELGYLLLPVHLDEKDIKGFYQGFSNEVLWPLFHEFQLPLGHDPQCWDAYGSANRKFAEVTLNATDENDFIWVHDYHLMLLASLFKEMEQARRTGFFLHIPFPPADVFMKLPWRRQIVDALLDFDLVGFQTVRDRQNFYEVVKRLHRGAFKRGRGSVNSLSVDGNRTRLGTFPVSIDFKAFAAVAARPEVKAQSKDIRAAFGDRFLLFGADRLDYTKGIPRRLGAIREVLRTYPELRERICMVQILVPSRQEVPQYKAMKIEIERAVGELNGQFATPGWTPVHYVYRNLEREELVSYYLAADMALITPLRDGMNLVAKEYAACNPSGILCLSEFAGAAMEFHSHALMVNPFDIRGMAGAIRQAVDIPMSRRRRTMRNIRGILRRHDIFAWVDGFLMSAFSKHLDDFHPWPEEKWQEWEAVQGPPWSDE